MGTLVLTGLILLALIAVLWLWTRRRRSWAEPPSQRLLDALPDGLLSVDADWRIVHANAAVSDMLGVPPREWVGRELWELLPPSMSASLRARYEAALLENAPLRFQEFHAALQRWLEIRMQASGKQTAVLLRDVTEQKKQDDTRSFLASIVVSAEDAIIGLTLDGAVFTWNQSAERIFGYSAAEARGKTLASLFNADQLHLTSTLPQPGQVSTLETRLATKSGRVVEVSLTTFLVLGGDGTPVGVSVISRDVTERNRMAAKLQEAEQMITIGRLAGGAAHFYNNLLTVISGNAQLLAQDLPAGDPRLAEVRQVLEAADRAAALTSQLLAVGKKRILQPRQLNFDEAVTDIASVLREVLPETIELRTALRSEGSPVLLDPAQLREVLLELVVNARNAMPDGGTITVESSLVQPSDPRPVPELAADTAYVRLVVQDTGRGMDEETLSRVFEPFFTTKDRIKVPGLGLSAVDGLVQQAGGRVLVESQLLRGTRVTAFFPVARPAAAGASQPGATPATGRRRSILIVEDEGTLRTLIRVVLERAGGYSVLEAKDGQEALEVIDQGGVLPDLLITDIRMPQRGGVSLVQELRRRDPATRAIFISGYSHEELIEDGVFDMDIPLLKKPFSMPALIEMVRGELSKERSMAMSAGT